MPSEKVGEINRGAIVGGGAEGSLANQGVTVRAENASGVHGKFRGDE